MRQKQILVVRDMAYPAVSDSLLAGALSVLDKADIVSRVVNVPNISQMPAVVRFAVRTMELRTGDDKYAGYVLLGCSDPIQHEADALMFQAVYENIQSLKMDYSLAVGMKVILPSDENKISEFVPAETANAGMAAAQECLRMLEIKKELGL